MATLDNQDVIIEILSWLSPEVLLRFKSVCKSWYALINNPKFVRKHFLNSLQHEHVFVKHFVTKNIVYRHVVCSILKFPPALDQSVSIIDVDLPSAYTYLEFNGYSHGLVCLSDRHQILLCNPSTREFRKLPPSILLFDPRRDPEGYHSHPDVVGFGYDTKSRDFKVVRIVGFSEGYWKFYPDRVEVYDLSKDRWREIEISVPQSCENIWVKCISLGVWNESIVLFHYPYKPNGEPFDIWEMDMWEMDIWKMSKNECGGVSWSKLLTIRPFSGIQIEKSLWFVSSDELLMEARELRQLILYNIKTQQFKLLSITGDRDSFEATSFVKSLVYVKGGNNIIGYEF